MRHGLLTLTFLVLAKAAFAQSEGAAKLRTGKEIFEAGCVGCHGSRDEGAPQSSIGFDKPRTFPDFTQCLAAGVVFRGGLHDFIPEGKSGPDID
jgi:hypothetical protein